MNLSYSPEYETFRAEVREFLQEKWVNATAGTSVAGETEAAFGNLVRPDERTTAFRIQAVEAGYLYRNVPRQYGGSDQPFDPLKSAIIAEEFKKVRAPFEMVGQGASMLVPTLLEHGTEKQKERFVRDTLLGKLFWCQGYSEPGSGSDLASLRTRAELDGDSWVVNGQKIWTSNAQEADWMFCLVRTEPEAPKHDGITYLLIDMKTPGLDIRPLRQITGDADFNEVFLDNVRVPKENVVGERGKGWAVSRSTLKHERALIGGSWITRRMYEGVLAFAQALPLRGRPAIQDPGIRQRLADAETRLLASEYHGLRLLTMQSRGEDPGMAGAVTKLYGTQLAYDIGKIAMDVMSDRGALANGEMNAPAMGMFAHAYMWTLGILIAGGTTNIQRNVIAERFLGMPRDPATAAKKP